MSRELRGALWRALKDAGVNFDRPYREHTTEELQAAYDKLAEHGAAPKLQFKEPAPKQVTQEEQMWQEPQGETVSKADFNALVESMSKLTEMVGAVMTTPLAAPKVITYENKEEVAAADLRPAEVMTRKPAVHETEPSVRESAGLEEDEILFTDDEGLQWYRREVRKAATPKPRGRRVLTYVDTGVVEKTVKDGKYVETFEVADENGTPRTAEVKITLPTYQTGIYKDPRLPFKVHVYNNVRGFDLFDIWDYFGGETLVPEECKRMYVSNDLCYDIRSVVNYIEAEYRRMQLQGRVR